MSQIDTGHTQIHDTYCEMLLTRPECVKKVEIEAAPV